MYARLIKFGPNNKGKWLKAMDDGFYGMFFGIWQDYVLLVLCSLRGCIGIWQLSANGLRVGPNQHVEYK